MRVRGSLLAVLGVLVLACVPSALADGSESLGVPSVPLAAGSGVLAAGVGTETGQPASFSFSVPGSVKQVLLYWTGHYSQDLGGSGDNTITIGNGTGGTNVYGKTAPGPDFGCPTQNRKYANKVTFSSGGTLTKISAWMKGNGGAGSQQFRTMVYADAGGSPGALLATSATVTVAASDPAGNVDFAISPGVSLAAGDYWLAQQSGATSAKACLSQATGAAGTNVFNTDSFGNGPDDPFGSVSTSTAEYTISASLDSAGTSNVTGTLIGGPTLFFTSGVDFHFATYRADITNLGLVASGSNTLTVSGLNFVGRDGFGNDGASVLVTYDDGSGSTLVGIRDGQDLAFYPGITLSPPTDLSASQRQTEPQTFTFAPSGTARTANIAALAASVEGPASGHGPLRPNRIKVTFGLPGNAGDTELMNPFMSLSGPEYDAINLNVTVPAGASQMTLQALSLPGDEQPDPANPRPASFAWIGAGLTLPAPAPCSLGDFVWVDTNGNGIQDDGPTGVNGVLVELLDSTGTVVLQTTTTANNPVGGAPGWYSFSVDCGVTYKVRVAASNFTGGGPLVGKTPTTFHAGGNPALDSDGDANSTSPPVSVPSGNDPTIDFGYVMPPPPTCSLGDFVWVDTNGNGIQDDGPTGVNGVIVQLLDSGGNVVQTTTTANNPVGGAPGWYSFSVDCGVTYKVRVAASNFTGGGPLVGKTPTTFHAGGNPALDSDGDANSTSPPVSVPSGNDPTIDFGYVMPPPPTCSLGDFVWIDLNGNGIQDDGPNSGVNGVIVELLDSNGNVVQTTTTADNPVGGAAGWYSFSIDCGVTYRVRVSPSNFTPGGPLPGKTPTTFHAGSNPALDSDGDANSTSPPVSVPSGNNPTIDFGYLCPVVICPPDGKFGGNLTTSLDASGNLHISFDQFTQFNDNSYGVNAVGWGGPGKHKFDQLVGSDKAEFSVANAAGNEVMHFTLDYITCDPKKVSSPSGCASLGASGGDGSLKTGQLSWLLSYDTSLAHNLNDLGFCSGGSCVVSGVDLKVDSPPTAGPDDYTLTNPAFTGWNFSNRYEAVISKNAAPAGFGNVTVVMVHNSPGKKDASCTATPGGLCAKDTKIASLDIQYTAKPCSASHNSQPADKANCSGSTNDPISAGPVRLVIMDKQLKNGAVDKDAKKYVDQTVSPGAIVTASSTAIGEKSFKSDTYYAIFSGNTLLQSGKFHTSCSQPIAVGDQFGSLLLTGGTSTKK